MDLCIIPMTQSLLWSSHTWPDYTDIGRYNCTWRREFFMFVWASLNSWSWRVSQPRISIVYFILDLFFFLLHRAFSHWSVPTCIYLLLHTVYRYIGWLHRYLFSLILILPFEWAIHSLCVVLFNQPLYFWEIDITTYLSVDLVVTQWIEDIPSAHTSLWCLALYVLYFNDTITTLLFAVFGGGFERTAFCNQCFMSNKLYIFW